MLLNTVSVVSHILLCLQKNCWKEIKELQWRICFPAVDPVISLTMSLTETETGVMNNNDCNATTSAANEYGSLKTNGSSELEKKLEKH